MAGAWVADRRLYLTKGRERVVEAGDPEAKSLLVGKGAKVTDADCKQYGLGPYAAKAVAPPTEGDVAGLGADVPATPEPDEQAPQIERQSAAKPPSRRR